MNFKRLNNSFRLVTQTECKHELNPGFVVPNIDIYMKQNKYTAIVLLSALHVCQYYKLRYNFGKLNRDDFC